MCRAVADVVVDREWVRSLLPRSVRAFVRSRVAFRFPSAERAASIGCVGPTLLVS
jgi:hypothetical protein